MKPSFHSASVGPYPKEVFKCIVRGYKYIRSAQILSDIEDIPDKTTSNFINKLKKAKTLTKLSLETDAPFYINIKPKTIQAVLNRHSQTMKDLELPTFCSHFATLPYERLKNLRILTTSNRKVNMRSLKSQRCLEYIFLNIRHQNIQGSRLVSVLSRLYKLRSLDLLSSPALLKITLEFLNRLSVEGDSSRKIRISTIEDEVFDELPEMSSSVSLNVTGLSLQNINTSSLLSKLFNRPGYLFPNLKNLKLGLKVPDPLFMSYLKYLGKMECLERLSLYLSECWSKDVSKALIENLQLPVSLRKLKLNMWLSLEVLTVQENGQERYSCDSFEKEPLCILFFRMLENLKKLEEITLNFQMLEHFRSYYTGFFVSILNRLHNIRCLTIQAIDYKDPNSPDQAPECCNIALLLASCSKMNDLKHLEIIMPNLTFENSKMNCSLSQLKSFDIGIPGLKEEDSVMCKDAPQWVQGLIRMLTKNAPNLSSLMLDFGEIIDERTLCKRFMLLEKLKDLEMLYMKLFIREFSGEKIRSVGKSLQILKKLQSVILRFPESDDRILELKPYIQYKGSLRDVIVSCRKATWMSNGYLYSVERKEEQNEDDFNAATEDEDIQDLNEVEVEEAV